MLARSAEEKVKFDRLDRELTWPADDGAVPLLLLFLFAFSHVAFLSCSASEPPHISGGVVQGSCPQCSQALCKARLLSLCKLKGCFIE